MAKTKNNKTNMIHTIQNKWKIIVLVFGLGCLIAVAFNWYWFNSNSSFFSRDPAQVKQELLNTLGAIELQGERVLTEVNDNRCTAKNSVGAEHFVHCDMHAIKLFVQAGEVKRGLKIAEKSILNLGYQRAPLYPTTNDDFNAIIEGDKKGTLVYEDGLETTSGISGTILTLVYLVNGTGSSGVSWDDLLENGQISEPKSGEYIIGVALNNRYFSCRSGSFEVWKRPCPTPPAQVD